MAASLSNLGKIVSDFQSSLAETLGQGKGSPAANKGGTSDELFNTKVGGSTFLETQNWVGNTRVPNTVKYGFKILDSKELNEGSLFIDETDSNSFILQIAPQAISQKEIFATNIQATRKGIVVETEGVIFRDIVISGTTGVFPGERGSFNSARSSASFSNLNSFTKPTQKQEGVTPEGASTKAGVTTISGYEEFLRLRQFFLRYAKEKVESNGDRFLIFINQKDNQFVVTEPLEFTMDRNSKNPLQYMYKIVLKGIGNADGILFGAGAGSLEEKGAIVGFLEKVGVVSENVQARIAQGRLLINQSARFIERIGEAITGTINGPLQQLQFATEDLKDGLSTVLSLPEILIRNVKQSTLTIRGNTEAILGLLNKSISGRTEAFQVMTPAQRQDYATSQQETYSILSKIETDNRIPIPRTFVDNVKTEMKDFSNNVADFTGLGSEAYNNIQGRVTTLSPDPLKVVSDEEFLLMGAVQDIIRSTNLLLASNVSFESDAEETFRKASEQFNSPTVSEQNRIEVVKPRSVREIVINRGDTLERIAQREYGNPARWLDLVVINKLKPPYISDAGGQGVKKPGQKLLIGNS